MQGIFQKVLKGELSLLVFICSCSNDFRHRKAPHHKQSFPRVLNTKPYLLGPTIKHWIEAIFLAKCGIFQLLSITASAESSQCEPAWAGRIMGCEQWYPVCGLVRLKQSIEATFDYSAGVLCALHYWSPVATGLKGLEPPKCCWHPQDFDLMRDVVHMSGSTKIDLSLSLSQLRSKKKDVFIKYPPHGTTFCGTH